MEDYSVITNAAYFYAVGFLIFLIIMVQAVLFMRLAWKEGKRLGIDSQKMFRGLRAGMAASVLPSVSIVLILLGMAGKLGAPFPWIRLSVIGSGPYELLAAGIGAKSMGLSGLEDKGFNVFAFANAAWVMTIGATWSGLMVFLFTRTIKKHYNKLAGKDPEWMRIITNAAFFGVVCVFLAEPVIRGGIPLLTLLSGAMIMVLFVILIVKFKCEFLKEFALPVSMLGAMTAAALFSGIS